MNHDWVNNCYRLGVTADVALGAVKQNSVERIDPALINLDGNFFAAEDICSDFGHTPLDGVVKDSAVECVGCGLSFRIAFGKYVAGVTPQILSTIPVMVVGDEIFVWIENLSESSQS